ncbi:DUF6455 family protein [Roseovarius sp. MMSF_3281]|uniref:DUF6455 family protein n=1 Tax=Roseovarius sp. MMSF_3281 TaxID=3046694 RepID=UPI00273DECB2|nr:DUF6455 family protein [Roseovarius sp. MMSF_3281]
MTAQLSHLGDPNLHFWLTRSVARAVHVNLSDALAAGRLTPAHYADMVTKCRRCPYVSTCEAWLAENAAGAPAVPAHCANADLLNTLIEDMGPTSLH